MQRIKKTQSTMKPQNLMILLFTAIFFAGCKKDNNEPTNKKPLDIPSEYGYDSVSFQTNASQALNYAKAQLDLESELRKGRVITYILEKSKLDSMYQILKPITPTPIQQLIEKYLEDIVKGSGKTYDPNNPTQEGIYGGYIFNKEGVDVHEIITKTLWGVSFINQMKSITNNISTTNQIDPMLVYYGAHPYFKNSSNTTIHGVYADKFSANYAARRDKNDGNGFYSKIKYSFLKLKAAIQAGNEYNQEKQDAINDIYKNIEKAYAATIINYCFSATSKLSISNPTNNDIASAMHAIGECIAFTINLQYLNPKSLSDNDIQFIFSQLNYGTTTNINLFATQTFNQLPKLNNIVQRLKSVYGFSDMEIEEFKKNWVQEQNR